jgi:hypothetical protein
VGTLQFGVIGRGTIFWEWMIGREGVCRWGTHQRGKEGSRKEDKGWRIRLERSDPVEVVLFEDGTKPSKVDACSTSPLVKLVIWFGGYRDVNRSVP